MHKIFLIAGLGADTRLFNNIDLGDNDVTRLTGLNLTSMTL
jgi:hypothetical protein